MRKIKYAVLGQGYIAQSAVLPAFAHAKENSELYAIVSENPEKLNVLAKKYKVPNTFDLSEFDACLRCGIDAVFICVPNAQHAEYANRAAAAGIHVLCEKPMAMTATDCESMIRTAKASQVKLMIAYRLHFEESNLTVLDMVRRGKIGEPRFFSSTFSMQVKEGNIRVRKDLGGGPLFDLGIYCINAARNLFESEPIEATGFGASCNDIRFREVPEMVSAVLRFPKERLAQFTCSLGAGDTSQYSIIGTKGALRLTPAFDFVASPTQSLHLDGKQKETRYRPRDQFAPELIYFSNCILEHKNPEPSGEEGLADVRAMQAVMQSIETNKPFRIEAHGEKRQRLTIEQEIYRPPVDKTELVRATRPSA